MSLCQLLSILELFHIADGIEKARLLPRFVQVCITLIINHTDVAKILYSWWSVRAVCFSGYGEEPPADHGHHAGGDPE